MKQLKNTALLSYAALAVCVAGCSSGGLTSSESVSFSLAIGNTDVDSVSFTLDCESGTELSGELNVIDDREKPIWNTIMALPPGDCTVNLVAGDDSGAAICTGKSEFVVIAGQTVKVDVVLMCGGAAEDPLGNVDIDGTFEEVSGNLCPRLHFLNVVSRSIPEGGTGQVSVLTNDPDGGEPSVMLLATSGSFADPAAASTTYSCGAAGTQTVSVTVGDGDAACDQTKSFDVLCFGGSGDACAGVVCEDDGNELHHK